MWFAFLTLALVCEAHVKLLHKPYFSLPIRNAPTPSADGTLSTAGPCGGSMVWGNRGFSPVSVGDNLTLVFAYNGGHQSATENMIRISMVCGKIGNDKQLGNRTANIATVTSPLVDAADSSTSGYDVWVVIPQPPMITDGKFCTISALDNRNWGGCIDVEVLSTPTPAPVPGQNALTGKTVAGVYQLKEAQCAYDSPNCCCVTGSLTVVHDPGAPNATGTAHFSTCNFTKNSSRPIDLTFPVTLTQQAANLGSLKGTASAQTNTIGFQLSAGATASSNSVVMTDDSPLPMYCGLDTQLFASAIGPGAAFSMLGQGSGSQSTAAIVMAILAVCAVGVACYFFGHIITARISGLAGKATPINVAFQLFLFALGAAALGGEWAEGSGYTFSLWSLCGPLATGEGCMDSADVAEMSAPLLRAVQAFTVIGMVLAIIAMLVYGVSLVYSLGEMSFKVLFGFTVLQVTSFFLAVCFFGGYFNDQLSDVMSVSWGYGLLIAAWMLAMFATPFAKLATEAKSTSAK